MLLKQKPVCQDMADVNVYTANRLSEMAASLGQLARAFSDEEEEGRLSKEDAKMAMQTAASMVWRRLQADAVCHQIVKKKTAIICITFSGHLSRTAKYGTKICHAFFWKPAEERTLICGS